MKEYVVMIIFVAAVAVITSIASIVLDAKIHTWLGDRMHGKTLESFMHIARKDTYESLAVFNRSGRKILEYTECNTEKCHLQRALILYCRLHRGVTVVHNHLQDATFSYWDVITTLRLTAEQCIVVSPTHNYYLTIPKTLRSDERRVAVAFNRQQSHMQETAFNPYNNETIYHNTHLAMQHIADDLGCLYRRASAEATLD